MKIAKIISRERALVLGGGGATGNAWLIGVITGLFDSAVDLTRADLIIGTSAGSTVAAQICNATRLEDLLHNILAEVPQFQASTGSSTHIQALKKPTTNLIEITNRIINTAKDATDMRRRIAAALLEIDEGSEGSRQLQWRAIVAARLANQQWPEQSMLIPAVEAHTGESVIFDRHTGVDLVDAVAASTAGGFAYCIGNSRYIDGGYRADLNADLATGYKRVLVVAPLGDRTRKPLEWGLHLSAQVDELIAKGSIVKTIFPDRQSQNAMGMGMDVMNLMRRQTSAQSGYYQGKALAEQLNEFWQ